MHRTGQDSFDGGLLWGGGGEDIVGWLKKVLRDKQKRVNEERTILKKHTLLSSLS